MSAKIIQFAPKEERKLTGRTIVTIRAGFPSLNVQVQMDEASYYSLWEAPDQDGMTRVRAIAATLLYAGANEILPCTISTLRKNQKHMIQLQKELVDERAQRNAQDTGPQGA